MQQAIDSQITRRAREQAVRSLRRSAHRPQRALHQAGHIGSRRTECCAMERTSGLGPRRCGLKPEESIRPGNSGLGPRTGEAGGERQRRVLNLRNPISGPPSISIADSQTPGRRARAVPAQYGLQNLRNVLSAVEPWPRAGWDEAKPGCHGFPHFHSCRIHPFIVLKGEGPSRQNGDGVPPKPRCRRVPNALAPAVVVFRRTATSGNLAPFQMHCQAMSAISSLTWA